MIARIIKSIQVLVLALVIIAPSTGASLAITPEERLDDPKLEERARNLSLELRCLVCQNQSIDDSDAPFAQDLRRLIRRDIAAGKSDGEIKDFLRQRYGDYVLLSPPLTESTYLLWITPFAILALGVVVVALNRRNRKMTSDAEPDSHGDQS